MADDRTRVDADTTRISAIWRTHRVRNRAQTPPAIARRVRLARDDGVGEDLTEVATRLARTGLVVFARGELSQPVTFVGWSMGATLALQGGLTEQIDPSGEIVSCFPEVPRAIVDAVAAAQART